VPFTVAHLHLVSKRRYSQLIVAAKLDSRRGKGIWIAPTQAIISSVGKQRLERWQILAHELLHAQSFQSMMGASGKSEPRRVGLSMYCPKRRLKYFDQFNEALTEELAMRFDRDHFPHIAELAPHIADRAAFRSGTENHPEEIASYRTWRLKGGWWRTEVEEYAYRSERQYLWQIIRQISAATRETTSPLNPEDIFQMFVRAAYSGRLLPLARLIRQTLGKGAFRELAEETAISDS
jgi:hypothetical protein